MNRRDVLRGMLSAAVAAVAPAVAAPALRDGILGRVEGVKFIDSGLIIGLDVARDVDAAVASLIRPTLEGFDIVEIARLARPETLEQVREWVDKIAQEHGARRIMVHSPRDNELEAWRNHGQRRAEQERLRTSYYMREEEKRLRALAESQRIYEQECRPPPRGERIRAIMRQRMAGWSYGPGSLLDHWRALA